MPKLKYSFPEVLGVAHAYPHPDFPRIESYLRENVNPGDRIGFESGTKTVKGIFFSARVWPATKDISYTYTLCKLIQGLDATPVPVEDKRIYDLRERRELSMGDDHIWDYDWISQKLGVMSSVRLLEMARRRTCSHVLVGAFHAYDLEKMGYPKITFLTDKEKTEKLDRNLEKFSTPDLIERVRKSSPGRKSTTDL